MTIEELLADGWYDLPTTTTEALHSIRPSRQKRDQWLEEIASNNEDLDEHDVTGKN